jgi:transposase
MARQRRTSTNEFEVEAVKLVTEQGRSVAEAARSLGISENLLRSWKAALQAQGEQAFPGHGRASPPSRTNSAASAPRTRGCGWSATS